ncbi:MAG TPA: (E)-4-hydroxy-3-methylbut-2-enyl-diphosphate synthase [Chitinophagaceae bacterium]|nr:(E)-4-hydroxy-3-methylbut-2-enyl-diphosphate synthase [Chitinophagaceae bacterium]
MQRLKTREVKIGNIWIGAQHPISKQTMTTTDTMNTEATVAEIIRCIEEGADLVRITAPSKKEAENLINIKNQIREKGYDTPLVADIHFTPNAAEIAATIVEKVRINPGNYIDKKKFQKIEYTDQEYQEEIERIRERFTPLVLICKEHGTAMRIGTNHGSLSDRIMSRYGDTALGMVESAMEFLRIARSLDYHQIVLSMKSSNPHVMIEAYRLLVKHMQNEFDECYPLHLGVTEAGDGEDGRIKSAIGIGTLLNEGIGDTIRVSLTEDPEFELPVCENIIDLYAHHHAPLTKYHPPKIQEIQSKNKNHPNFESFKIPRVITDFSKIAQLTPVDLEAAGYVYDQENDKWKIGDQAADYIFCNQTPSFALPGTLGVITYYEQWLPYCANTHCYPLFDILQFIEASYIKHDKMNFVMMDTKPNVYNEKIYQRIIEKLKGDPTIVLCLSSQSNQAIDEIRSRINELQEQSIYKPTIIIIDDQNDSFEKSLIHYAVEAGALFLEDCLHGIILGYQFDVPISKDIARKQIKQLNSISFGILQATRKRISKTEYISCPSCGRTLFNLQETTAKIRAVTNHLKGVKIAVMGCIVNGPGEMADADFGYVGSGVGKVTLYKGKEVVKRNIDSEVAVHELVELLKINGVWIEPE